MPAWSRSPWLHIALVALVSAGFELLFVHHSINLMDEGWPLYAAMGLHEGGDLYRDVFFVFPPGHLLSAWIALALDPPGIVLARFFYGGFVVALCVAIYGLGRRLMPPGWALLGALLLAVAGASAHRYHLVFGYRYLLFSALALLFFSRRLDTGSWRWMFASGLAAGVALYFRLTPAFAVSVGVAIGVMAAGGSWRGWIRDWSAYGVGLLLVIGPVVAWFLASVGPEALWREAVVRPVVMTDLQSLPMPSLEASPPSWERRKVMRWFVGVQFRLYLVLYASYALALLVLWGRALLARRPFAHPLLLAVVVWGGIYFVRTLGRSDAAHLYSAIPPVCLLLGHALSLGLPRLPGAVGRAVGVRVQAAIAAAFLVVWVLLMGSDRFLDPERRGQVPLRTLDGRISLNATDFQELVDGTVERIRAHTEPGDRILDLAAAPLFYVLAGRPGPGRMDVVIPGTFMTPEEEAEFVAWLEESPPALVIWPGRSFDRDPERAVRKTAPRLSAWVRRNYRFEGPRLRYTVMLPVDPAR